MFAFFQQRHVRAPSLALERALAAHALPPGLTPSSLRVLETAGNYAGRPVHFLLVFDPLRAGELGVAVHGAADLEGHPDLVLASGHREQDGSILLKPPAGRAEASAPSRQRADRSTHADDESVVFPVERST